MLYSLFLQGGETPLIWAIRNGHSKVVYELLDKGANMEAEDEVINDGWL